MSVRRGVFVTIEGGEGSGKSTLIHGLAEKLEAKGLTVVSTREPGGTPLAENVRDLVLSPPDDDPWSPLAEALLMNAARSDHVDKKISPALMRGDWVICDRFSDSTLVYQGISGVRNEILLAMQTEVTSLARPDITFILDAEPEALLGRRQTRATSDVFERRPIEFHRKVREAFLKIAEADPERCAVLDAMLSPSQLLGSAVAILEERAVSV